MAGKLRYALAAGFVVLFFVLLGQQPDHRGIAFLKTKGWLKDEVLSAAPFTVTDADGEIEALHPIRLRVSILPPLEAGTDRSEDYARIGREWSRAAEAAVEPVTTGEPIDAFLQVRIGDNGFLSTLLPSDRAEPMALELRRDQEGAGYYPDGWSLLPAFLAIVLAILTGKVIPSLLAGCLAGAFLFRHAVFGAVEHLATSVLWERTLTEDFNMTIVGFVVFLFMAVGVMTKAGGVQGMVELVRRFARGPISTQICSYLIGILIFFDDYTNCILTGTTMRPLADRNRVSREKLSYIVDATAAPIAGISIFSTWVAYEISMFKDQLPEVTRPDPITGQLAPYSEGEGFSVFLQTLPFRYYCIFTLAAVLLTILLRRDFGPMLAAERRARQTGKTIADDAKPMISGGFDSLTAGDDIPHRARNALLPIAVLVIATLYLIYDFGVTALGPAADQAASFGEHLRAVLGATDSARALFWASLIAFAVAVVLVLGQRILSFATTVQSALRSAWSLVFAIVILILAWAIGHICKDLGTADFLTATLQQNIAPWSLPALMFVLSALVAFSTGTSYGTMAILLPNVVVLAHSLGSESELLTGPGLMVLTIGAVLEGSIFGDHCSPISDTTVLSSVATGSDHLHHVRTQAPYAVLVMAVALLGGYLPTALIGPSFWPFAWLIGIGSLVAWFLVVGRNPERHGAAPVELNRETRST